MEARQVLAAACAVNYVVPVFPHGPQHFVGLDGQTDRPSLACPSDLANGTEMFCLGCQDLLGEASIQEVFPSNHGLFLDSQFDVVGA